VALNCSYCTPDDGYRNYPKHVQWSCNEIKIQCCILLDISCMYIRYALFKTSLTLTLMATTKNDNCLLIERKPGLTQAASTSNLRWQNLDKCHILTTYILRTANHLSATRMSLYSRRHTLELVFFWGSSLARLHLNLQLSDYINLYRSLSVKSAHVSMNLQKTRQIKS
jgi:hypothetical protein